MTDLEKARKEERAAFADFAEKSAMAQTFTVESNAARHRWLLARSEVRAQESDLLSWPVQLSAKQ